MVFWMMAHILCWPNENPMIQSYIRTALRNFRKNKITSVINLCGLTLGLATCLVAGLYIKHELTADRFQKDLNTTYIVTAQVFEYSIGGTPYMLGETVEKEIPGVRDFNRLKSATTIIRIHNEKFKNEIIYTDPQFLSFFTFPLLYGDAKHALAGLRKVVLSHEISRKYFGNDNPVGQTVQIFLNDNYVDFEISGVTSPTPTYSSIQFDFLIPLQNLFSHGPESYDGWDDFNFTTLLKIDQDKAGTVKEGLSKIATAHLKGEKNADGSPALSLDVKPFAAHHLDEEGPIGDGIVKGHGARSLFVFSGIAIVILLLACFNFMNLTNAQASQRATEVGVRKIVGARKRQLVFQFLTEALVLAAFAAILALALAELGLLMFSDLLGAHLSVLSLRHLDVYAGLFMVTLLSGIVAGLYPAFILSHINALDGFKKYLRIGGHNAVTRSILSFQFGLSIVLIVCAITMWKQQVYMMNKDLGFNKEQVLVIPFSSRDTASIDYMKTGISKLAESLSVTRTTSFITRGGMETTYKMPDGSTTFIELLIVDDDFFSTLQMEMMHGRTFTAEDQGKEKIIVNETLLRMLNLQDSIDMRLGRRLGGISNPEIIGVVKDYHNVHMKAEIRPAVFVCSRFEAAWTNESFLMVRVNPGKLSAARKKIQSLWENVNSDSPFEYFFLDDEIQKQYEAEQRWSGVISLATGMAIFLSMLGLLGLAMYTLEQRRKEISIRKVLGASINQVITLLSKDYLWLILTAFVLAVPISNHIITQYWLNNFAYKISIGTAIYLLAGFVVVVMIGVAIGSQIIRASLQNPVETLKEN